MSKDYILINGTLYHHGILGQKWGIRRFQNKDGSYTAEGKQRYYKDYYGYSGEIKNKKTFRDAMKGAKDTFEYNKKWIDKNYDGTKRDKRYLKRAEKEIYKEGKKEIIDDFKKTKEYKKLKTAVGIGITVTASTLAIYGAYKVSKNIEDRRMREAAAIGQKMANDMFKKNGYYPAGGGTLLLADVPIKTFKTTINLDDINIPTKTNYVRTFNNDNFDKYNAMLSRLENQLQQDPSNMALRKQINEISKKIFD